MFVLVWLKSKHSCLFSYFQQKWKPPFTQKHVFLFVPVVKMFELLWAEWCMFTVCFHIHLKVESFSLSSLKSDFKQPLSMICDKQSKQLAGKPKPIQYSDYTSTMWKLEAQTLRGFTVTKETSCIQLLNFSISHFLLYSAEQT